MQCSKCGASTVKSAYKCRNCHAVVEIWPERKDHPVSIITELQILNDYLKERKENLKELQEIFNSMQETLEELKKIWPKNK